MHQDCDPYQPPRTRVDAPADASIDGERVLRGQKLALIAILLSLASMLMQSALGGAGYAIGALVLAVTVYAVVRLAAALRVSIVLRIMLALLMFVPVVNLATLFIVNLRAVRALRDAGYDVGLLGLP